MSQQKPVPVTKVDNKGGYVRIADLTKTYLEGGLQRIVLQDASLSIGQGQFVAILGKSGTGKSTLLNLISGIDVPDRGSVWIGDEELTRYSEHKRTLFRRQHIGFVFQFFNLIPTLTVLENTILPAELGGEDSNRATQRALGLLAAIGLSSRENTFPDKLSGGEQQRVAIARALICDPALVLADEPTGNLDEDTGAQVLHLLTHLTRDAGKNLIMVTHSRDAASQADRTLYLHEGRLIENGNLAL